MGRTPDRARGPLFIFRKIHLYGKTKKSTHGHQTAKPLRTHSPEPAEESNRAFPTPRPLPYSILQPTLYQRAYPIPPTLHRIPRTDEAREDTTKSDRPTLRHGAAYPIPDSGRGTARTTTTAAKSKQPTLYQSPREAYSDAPTGVSNTPSQTDLPYTRPPQPLRGPVLRGVHWGNLGEGRLTLSRS